MSDAPPIEDYAFLSDGAGVALVSREGSIDWCCVPRTDHGACFARLLGSEHNGLWALQPTAPHTTSRRYRDGSLILETTFVAGDGEVRLVDCMTTDPAAPEHVAGRLLRIVEGVRGAMELELTLRVRFDFGGLQPWRRRLGDGLYGFFGGDDGLLLGATRPLEETGDHDVHATVRIRAGERVGWSLQCVAPHDFTGQTFAAPGIDDLDEVLSATQQWWCAWNESSNDARRTTAAVRRSATVLKGLTNRLTGAIAAAATTSLPESPGGSLNWDYRYSWIRDSVFSVRALRATGHEDEAGAFREFIQRSAAGSAEQLQIMFGMGGERRLFEYELEHLRGYRGARPVRVGNAAARQFQLDSYGELMELSWRWLEHGHTADDDYWRFLCELVETVGRRWQEPDRGLWEMRGEPRHFVHSKVMCWAAMDRGIQIARRSDRPAPLERWSTVRDEIRCAIDDEGYDRRRGVYVQAFGATALDAAVLLIPSVGFTAYDDERMIRTTDAIRDELGVGGLVRRYRMDAGHGEPEGAFLPCCFWLAECLARQGRTDQAEQLFEQTCGAANDLGLFSEEYDVAAGRMLGNFPQALTHLSHITAALALAEASPPSRSEAVVPPAARA